MSKTTKRIDVNLSDSFWIVELNDEKKKVPLDCPVCDLTFHDIQDVKSYKETGTCTYCADTYVYANLKNCEKPSKEQRETQRKKRRSLPSYLV